MLRFPFLITLSTAVLIAGIPQTAQTQQTQGQSQAADTVQAVTQPAAIAAADLVVRGEDANERLRQVRSRTRAQPAVEEVAEGLTQLFATRDTLLADSTSLKPESASRRTLEIVQQRWVRYVGQIGEWREILTQRSQALGQEQNALLPVRAEWQATAEAAADQDYPQAAVQVIRSVQAAVDSVDAQIHVRLDTVLTLQSQLAELGDEATEVLARMEAAEAKARTGLFSAESPPLWTAITSAEAKPSMAQVREGLQEDFRTLTRFMEDAAERLPVQGFFLLVLLVLMIALRRRSLHWAEEDPELYASARIFDRPFSAVLLIMVITTRLFHTQIPPALVDLNSLLVIIPLVRLLPSQLHPALRRPLYAVAALWLLDGLLDFLPERSALLRLALLLVTALALATFAWFLKVRGPVVAEAHGRWVQGALRVARLGLVTLGTSLVANILGFVALATLLTDATLGSVVLAAALFAGVRIVEVLVRLTLRTDIARSVGSLRRHSNLVIRRTISLTKLGAVAIWAYWTLDWFDLLQPMLGAGDTLLRTPLSVGMMSISLGDILVFVFAIWLATLVSRFTRFVLEEDVFPRLALPRGVPGAITKVSQYIILGLGLMFAFAAAGIDLSSLALLAGALGVGIGFGLQSIVNNFVSGLILIFERPIQVGDTIELQELIGTVKHIGIRASTVRTFDGAEVIVPNADLIGGRVVNWTLSDRLRRMEVAVGVAYGTNPRQVKDVLLEVVRGNSEVLDNPEPFVLFQGFGDSSLDFVLRFWTSNFANWLTIQSDVYFAVHDALDAAGIEIPFPQRDLHLRSVDTSIFGQRVAEALSDRGDDEPAA